jgi:hydroxyacylglutathione hydrolase
MNVPALELNKTVWLKVALAALLVGCASNATDDGAAASEALVEAYPEVGTGTLESAVDMPDEWPNNGSADCVDHQNSEPSIFKFKYDENTIILRENKCLNFEANFIYVLFGHDKVFVQDSGSIPQGVSRAKFTQLFPIRDTIEGLITEYLAAHPEKDGTVRPRESVELLITHSHSHGDHVSGDYQFVQADGTFYPHTTVVGYRPQQVAAFFGITNWPTTPATLDLGGRKLDVLGIPGHEAAHVAIYDHGSQLLLSGDSMYPGHIFINSWPQFRDSMTRLNAFMHEKDEKGAYLRPVVYALGTHIEKKPTASQFYPYPSWVQDPERKLELFMSDLEFMAAQVEALGPNGPTREVFFPNFSIDP